MNDLQLFAKCYVEVHDLSTEDKKKLFEFIDTAKDYEIMNLLTTGRPESLPVEQASLVEANFQNTIVYPCVMLSELDPFVVTGQTAHIGKFQVPKAITNVLWSLAKKVTGGKPAASLGKFELWLDKADVAQAAAVFDKLIKGAAAGGFIVSGLVVAALFIFLTRKVLHTMLSKARKACRNLPKHKRIECLRKYKLEAIKAQIQLLKKGISSCTETKNPAKCKRKIEKKIVKLQKELQKAQKKEI